MNHLAHLALADEDLLVGSFLGDHIKGRLKGELPADVERGVQFHRAIDAYTDSHEIVRRSAARFDPEFRRFAGIITDVVYDYLLANSWHDYYEPPLAEFSSRTLMKLLDQRAHLTPMARHTAQRMHDHNSLAHYGTEAFLENAFISIGRRLSRANPLDRALAPCLELRRELMLDFSVFYPELMEFCENWKQAGYNAPR